MVVQARVRESTRTVLGDDEEILDPESTEADTIEAGLDGHHVTFVQNVLRGLGVERKFVDFEADTVARPVEEPVAVAGLDEHTAAGAVDRARPDPRSDGVDPGGVVTATRVRRALVADSSAHR